MSPLHKSIQHSPNSFDQMFKDLGGVRRKMTRKNCERINAVKTVKV